MTTLYAGYLHTVPRLVTLFAIQFGLKSAPFIMNLFSLLIAAVSISYIFSKDFRFIIKNDFLRFITAIFIICMPTQEVFLNITNIQWPLSIYLILWTTNLILGSGSTSPAKAIFALLGFLTCPVGVILLPALAWYVYTSRSLPVLAVLSISVLSNLFYLSSGSVGGRGFADPINIIKFISTQIFTSFCFFPPSNIVAQYGYGITYVITLILLIIFVYYARDKEPIDVWIGYLIVAYILLIAITRANFLNDLDTIMEARRYSFIPLCLMLIFCVRHASRKNYLMYLILFIFIANVASNYSITPFQDFDYQLSAEKFNASGDCYCVIPISPPGWFFNAPCACASLDAFAWCNNGYILDYWKKYEEAIDAYDEAIKLDPNYVKAWNNKGVSLGKLGQFDEGMRCFDEAIKIDSNNAEAWKNKGIVLYGQGKVDEAVKAYDEAIRLDPGLTIAWNNKGNALGKQGKFDEAIKAYDEAIRLDPKDAIAWKNKGNALMAQGSTTEANEAISRARSLGYKSQS